MNRVTCLLLALCAGCAGTMFDVGRDYQLEPGASKSVIYGKARHAVPRGQAVNVYLKNVDTGASYMLAVRSSLSAAPENDFVREIDPGRWVIDYAETSAAQAPTTTTNPAMPNAPPVMEMPMRQAEVKARPKDAPVFAIPAHALVYVGTWDLVSPELRVLDEKGQQDAALRREHTALDPAGAVVALPAP